MIMLGKIIDYGYMQDGYNGHIRSVVIVDTGRRYRVYWDDLLYFSIPYDCSLPVLA